MIDSQDIQHIQHALHLAAAGLGHTWPNPSVGAVVVKDGVVVGAAATARGGRPHAEPLALAQAGEKAKGSTLYVSLEPCSHHGKTPPCAQSVIAAGIHRVVGACTDPNPKVSGKGFAMLKSAGIEVVQGVCEAQARALNEGFFSVIERGRPFVALKVATSRDGKIAAEAGKPTRITGEETRSEVHRLRATYDAVITGIGTVLADDPELTCRLPGRQADSPLRVVLDSRLRIPPDARILPAWIITSVQAYEKQAEKVKALESKHARIFTLASSPEGLCLSEALKILKEQGITRLLVEAGSALSGSFMKERLVDRLYWFKASHALGQNALGAFKGQDIAALEKQMQLRNQKPFGDDLLEIFEPGAL